MPRSSDVWAVRSAAGSGQNMKETLACDAHRESRTSGVRACGSAGGCSRHGCSRVQPLCRKRCASKFAVVGLTQAAARAFAEHKITVNCFGPGVVHTALWDQLNTRICRKRHHIQAGSGNQRFQYGHLVGPVFNAKRYCRCDHLSRVV